MQKSMRERLGRKRVYLKKGEIETNEHIMKRLMNSIVKDDKTDCWVWIGAKRFQGYGAVTVKGKGEAAHRVMYMLIHGPVDRKTHICHKCDNPPCINPDHLFAGTASDNMKDCYRKGRSKIKPFPLHGERNGYAKLNWTNVIAIRHFHSIGICSREIAKIYKVDRHTINNVIANRTWISEDGNPPVYAINFNPLSKTGRPDTATLSSVPGAWKREND